MQDTVASCVTDNCALGASRGRADDSVLRDGLINHLTQRIAMYILRDEVITQCDTLLPGSLYRRRFSDCYDVIIMFRIVHCNKDLYLKIGNE